MTRRQDEPLVWLLIAWCVVLAAAAVGVGVLLSLLLYGDADVVGHRVTLAATAVLMTTAELTSPRTVTWLLRGWPRR